MSKNKFFLQVKLVTIGLIFSVFLVGFTCFFRIDKTVDDEDFVSYSNAAEEYYDRLDEVYDEYREEEQDVSKLIITSAFSVMSSHIQDFSYEDMSKRRMRKVADILLDNADEEGEAITFSDEAENKIKEQLADYFKSIDSDLSDITCQSMASDVFNYVEDYLEFTQGVENESTSSTSCDGNSYWWPIGSAETTTENGVTFASGDPVASEITAFFAGNDDVHQGDHGAIDISNDNGVGGTNIIAAKDGVVIYPTDDAQTQYADNGSLGNEDGGGLGNYVVIEHSDGNYTYYGHMSQGSITVRAGDSVKQGQVIGTMGNSGNSTGVHLHFEVRSGGDTQANRVDPLDYVSIDDPRPSCVDFSLGSTSLSKQEFISKMESYCSSSGNSAFCTNFSDHAEEVYDVSLESGVNPELVVVTAGTEQGWEKCAGLYNFWGIGIPNGQSCSAGPQLTSLAAGIREYADTLAEYQPGGSNASLIEERNQDREEAGCDPAGHGPPGTLAGMQSAYSWLGTYRYDPGSSSLGGCYYLNIIYGSNYCDTVPTGNDVPTTVCEQNDYTAWQLQEKLELRNTIFGL